MIIKKILVFFLRKFLTGSINNILEKKDIIILYRNGSAIGEQVYMTSIIKEISIQKKKRIFLFTNNREIFLNNNRISKCDAKHSRNY